VRYGEFRRVVSPGAKAFDQRLGPVLALTLLGRLYAFDADGGRRGRPHAGAAGLERRELSLESGAALGIPPRLDTLPCLVAAAPCRQRRVERRRLVGAHERAPTGTVESGRAQSELLVLFVIYFEYSKMR